MDEELDIPDLFGEHQYALGHASLDGEIEVIPLPETLEEPISNVPVVLQLDEALLAVRTERIEGDVDLTDAVIGETNDGQLAFIDTDEWWKVEWQGMPEYRQEDAQPWKALVVHFRTRDDMMEFATLTGQKLTADTRAIWYPIMHRKTLMNLFWVDENES